MLRVRVCGGLGGRGRRPRRCPTRCWAAGRAGWSSPTSSASGTGRCAREELAELLWADQLPDSWSASLQRGDLPPAPAARPRPGLDGAVGAALGGRHLPAALPAGGRVVDLERAASPRSTAAEAAADAGDVERRGRGRGGRRGDRGAGASSPTTASGSTRQRDGRARPRVRAALARSAAHLRSPALTAGRSRRPATRSPSTRRARRPTASSCGRSRPRASGARRCGCGSAAASTLVEELGVDPSPETEARLPRGPRRGAAAAAPGPTCAAVGRRHVPAHRHRRVVRAVGRRTRRRWPPRSSATTRSSPRSSPPTAARC